MHKTICSLIGAALLLGLAACVTPTETPTPAELMRPPTRPLLPSATPTQGPCGDGICDEAEQANASRCPQDCATPTAEPTSGEILPPPTRPLLASATLRELRCGDGVCDASEQADASLCPQDCATAEPPQKAACGDGVCDEAERADASLCPQDCVTPEPSPEATCGDGACDDAEQKNPSLCPQDCATPTVAPVVGETPIDETPVDETPVVTPTPTPAGQWEAEVVWGCDIDAGSGMAWHWTVDITYEFTVGADGTISGSGQGTGRQTSCTDPLCDCLLTLDPFTVEISGLRQEEAFSIHMDPEYRMMHYLSNCDEGAAGTQVEQLDLCVCPTGLPMDFTIDARDGATREIECTLPWAADVKVAGWIVLSPKKP